jgi:ribonuclease HI
MKIILYTDGGARGNPGPAGIGGVLYKLEPEETKFKTLNLKKIEEFSKYIGETTNNQAEYQALIFGLERAKLLGADEVECRLDSELIVNQLNRKYKVKDRKLGSLFLQVWNLSLGFKKINYKYIPREKNKEADFLVNQAINQAEKIKKIKTTLKKGRLSIEKIGENICFKIES